MKTNTHFRGRSPGFFHIHPFNGLFALSASIVLMFVLSLLLVLSVR